MNPEISVIIPTYNRPESLERLLGSLQAQTYPNEQFEVIVVDDGSNSDYSKILSASWGFAFYLLTQANGGEAVARNTGVQNARGAFLVFLDDDMEVMPGYLNALIQEHQSYPEAILIGAMFDRAGSKSTVFEKVYSQVRDYKIFGEIPFTQILGGVMAISKVLYNQLGGMDPIPEKKRGAWIDLGFSYKAFRRGMKLRRCQEAVVFHHDNALRTPEAAGKRMYNASLLAPQLFKLHPELIQYIKMYDDKWPIDLKKDSVRLVGRKFMRMVLSSQFVSLILSGIIHVVEKLYPSPRVLLLLYRWVIGRYIYRGFRQGLKEQRKNEIGD